MIETERSSTQVQEAPRSVPGALWRGLRQVCPACGAGALYWKYLKVVATCSACGEELHHHRTDDAPPYFTIVIVGHFAVGGVLLLEQAFAPPTWVQLAIWMPALLVASLWLLPRVKGALIGLQWALKMHGFGGPEPAVETLQQETPEQP
ncbi:MAG TPA: DUF983 domain-containing protein [Hyphomicrobiaceae bacterium]|nr:DUF983 domain-containing protein [Hyphomicrobiaceae bacterium]